GPARDPATEVGPLIDRSQFEKVSGYVELGRGLGRLVAGGETDDSVGYFVHPTVYADVDPESRLMQEEIFGPVLSLTRVDSFDDALRVANGTVYGLTGGVYARSPA